MKNIMIFIFCCFLASCAFKNDDEFYIGPSVEKSLPLGTSFTVDPNDLDGDHIPNKLDKEPYRASYPTISIRPKNKANFRFNLINEDSLIEYKMNNFVEIDDSIYSQSKLKLNALNRVVQFFKSKNLNYLRTSLSGLETLVINPYAEIDSVLNLKRLIERDYDAFEDKSGKVSIDGQVEAFGNYHKIFNINYILGFTDRNFTNNDNSMTSRLTSGEINIELSKQARLTKFDIFQTHINPHTLYNKFLKESGSMTIRIDNFDYQLKENGPVYNFKSVREKILNSTVTIQILTPEKLITENFYLKKASSVIEILGMIKQEEKEKKIFDDIGIKSLMGFKSDLNITNNWPFLKGREEGRWFIFSSKAINSPKTLFNNGDLVTIAYFKGDEIYKSAFETKRYSFYNFTGRTDWSFLPKIKKGENLSIVIEGVKKDVFSQKTSHSSEIRKIQKKYYLGGNYYSSSESDFSLKENSVGFSMFLNDEHITLDKFSDQIEYEKENSLVLFYDDFENEEDKSLVIDSGNHNTQMAGTYHLRVLDSYGNESFTKSSPANNFLKKYTYNVDIIIESFIK